MCFTENQDNRIVRVTITREMIGFNILTTASGPVGICKGGDNAIWFVEIMDNKIG